MKKKARIAVTRKLPATVETQLGEIFDPKFNLDDTPFSESQLIRAVNWADILVPTVTDQVNAKVINAAGPNLKLIANFGVGVNHIDLLGNGVNYNGFATFRRRRAYGQSRGLDRLDAYPVDGQSGVRTKSWHYWNGKNWASLGQTGTRFWYVNSLPQS